MKKIDVNFKKPSQQQLISLLELYQTRKYSDAEKLSASITQEFPKHPFAWKVLGATLKQMGKINESLVANQKSVQLYPQDSEAHNNLAITLKELDRLNEAEACYRKAIALKPEYIEAHNNLGNILQRLNRLDEAEACYRKVISLKPQYAGPHCSLGNILQIFGRLDKAEACYRRAITLKPDYAEAYNNLGNTLHVLGRFDEAELSYRKAIVLKTDYAEAYNNLSPTLYELGRLNEAETSCRQAIKLKPEYTEAHNNLGNILQALDRLDEAEACYRKAITLKPDYPESHLNLCELLEKMNRIDEISFITRYAFNKNLKMKSDFLYYEALYEFRKENYDTADEILKSINIYELLEYRQIAALKLKGDLFHYRKNYSAAFETYKIKNKIIMDSLEYKKQDSEKYFIKQREVIVQLKKLQENSSYKSVIRPRWIQPIFLIGFPRSGTTLLDTILRTHSNIDVLEELPILTKMKVSLGYVPTISLIENMDNKEVETASEFYIEELKKYIEVGKKKIIIDKLPLNILELPLINQIFPKARFILALRHPLDCILSCWMQNFKLNPAMANMVELKRIVDFYDTAMTILKLCKERYSLNIHIIRYEDLVLDFDENVSALLTFLGLDWEDDLRNYQKTALSRKKINTPSHSQVIKPIYKTASYRWKNYEKYLNPFKKQLEPWLLDYGY